MDPSADLSLRLVTIPGAVAISSIITSSNLNCSGENIIFVNEARYKRGIMVCSFFVFNKTRFFLKEENTLLCLENGFTSKVIIGFSKKWYLKVNCGE